MNIFQKQLMLEGRPLAIEAKKHGYTQQGEPEPAAPCSIEEFERDMRSTQEKVPS